MRSIRTIVVDDEPHSLEMLCGYLQEFSNNIEVIATASSAEEATKLVLKHQPELLFLDISMPGEDGLELVRKFPNPSFEFVYVTAHESYAVKAFELGAIHYLLKPIDLVQLNEAVERCEMKICGNANNSSTEDLHPDQLLVTVGNSHRLIDLGDIVYLQSEGSYTDIFLSDGSTLTTSKNLGFYETHLKKNRFYRTHRQFLVNLAKVRAITKGKSGYVEMSSGQSIQVSFNRKAGFLAELGSRFVSEE